MSEHPKPPPLAERPKCPGCGVTLKLEMSPEFHDIKTETGFRKGYTNHWTGGYEGYGEGRFHSMRCAVDYANWMFKRHGTRLERK